MRIFNSTAYVNGLRGDILSTIKFFPADKLANIPELKYNINKNIFRKTIVFVWFVIKVPKSSPKELPETDKIIDIISHYEKFSIESSLN